MRSGLAAALYIHGVPVNIPRYLVQGNQVLSYPPMIEYSSTIGHGAAFPQMCPQTIRATPNFSGTGRKSARQPSL
jgi:hypothetical protein